MNYEKGEIRLKDIVVSWILVDSDSVRFGDKPTEEFKFKIKNDLNKKSLTFDFNNSIMEREISEKIKEWNINTPQKYSQYKQQLRSQLWGGYDKLDFTQFKRKRIYYLVYGAINSFFSDGYEFSEYNGITFEWFCKSLGYDEDSRKAEQIYNTLKKQEKDLENLQLSDDFNKYIEDEIRQESDKYSNDLKLILDGKWRD